MKRDIEYITEAVRNGKGCTLLIGAGCSATAGIPTAPGVVERIRQDFPAAYRGANPKTYPRCMAQLSPGHRKDLIGGMISDAKMNWGHLAIAQLIKNEYVDRVLTTNFDPLVVRACAMVHEFPAVYDFAASQYFNPAFVSSPAVFHLHGQSKGFVLMNTEKECAEHAKRMEPVFANAGEGRVWIVVGYSGKNDPVFDQLAKVPRFDYGLYWVCYKDDAPGAHVRRDLLVEGKDAFYLEGYDADGFFVTLAQKLGCFPPDLVGRPFTHLGNIIDTLTPYTFPKQESELDVMERARYMIRAASDQYEKGSQPTKDGAQPPTHAARDLRYPRRCWPGIMTRRSPRRNQKLAARGLWAVHSSPGHTWPRATLFFRRRTQRRAGEQMNSTNKPGKSMRVPSRLSRVCKKHTGSGAAPSEIRPGGRKGKRRTISLRERTTGMSWH